MRVDTTQTTQPVIVSSVGPEDRDETDGTVPLKTQAVFIQEVLMCVAFICLDLCHN